jgi:hypothetical protein
MTLKTNAQTPRLLVIATLLFPMFLPLPAQAQQEKKASIEMFPVRRCAPIRIRAAEFAGQSGLH